jgi:hypothetical protein
MSGRKARAVSQKSPSLVKVATFDVMWVESSLWRPVETPSASMILPVMSSKRSRPFSLATSFARKLCSVFWQTWAFSGSRSSATCQPRSKSTRQIVSPSVRSFISLSSRTPITVWTGLLGRPFQSW